VNVSVDELLLPAPRSSVTTGGVLSGATVVVVVVVVVVVATVVVAATVVVVAATVVVTATAVVVGLETIAHFRFLPDLAQINLVAPAVTIFPAFVHLAPTSFAAIAELAPKPRTRARVTVIDFLNA
jgi:hypothetical protein